MRDFPRTEQRIDAVRKQFSEELEFASRMFSYWMDEPKVRLLKESPLPLIVTHFLRLVDVQVCRKFRSIILLCQNGEAMNASVIARSLYETVLVGYFLLKPDFSIAVVPNKDKKTGKAKPNEWHVAKSLLNGEKQHLDREFRATLIYAHSLFADAQKMSELASKFPDLTAVGPNWAERYSKLAKDTEGNIGPEWTYILRNHPRTYSGFNVLALAQFLNNGFDLWYENVYRDESREVHAARIMSHGSIDGESEQFAPAWFSSDAYVASAIYSGISLFFFYLRIVDEYVNVGSSMHMAVDGFKNAYLKLYGESPRIK